MLIKDLRTLTKHQLSLYNAGVSAIAYMYGVPAISPASTFMLFSGSCNLHSDLIATSTQVFNQVIEIE